jgi:hypothetical protein
MKAHELSPDMESALLQIRDPVHKLALVRRIKEDLLERLRPEADTWPISNDTIVVCALGRDVARRPGEEGQPIRPLSLAYFKALRWCVAIEEAPEWNDRYERRLIGALYQCANPLADVGEKFSKGRKLGTGGPIRKAIARLLKKNPLLKNVELWNMLASRPPRGWQFYDRPKIGRYIEGPKGGDGMSYARMRTVAAEERRKLEP